jgi:tetratricopeptide (TPR) repeat protein
MNVFCMNMHRSLEQSEEQGSSRSKFELDFLDDLIGQRLAGIGKALTFVTKWSRPDFLKKGFSFLEFCIQLEHGWEVKFIMHPRETESLKHALLEGSAIDTFYALFAEIRVQDAMTTLDKDRRRILKRIRFAPGFQYLGNRIQELLRGWALTLVIDLVEKEKAGNSHFIFFLKEVLTSIIHCHFHKYCRLRCCSKVAMVNSLSYAHLCNAIGQQFYRNGDCHVAMIIFQKALVVYKNLLGKNHPQTAQTYQNIGNAVFRMGDWHQALLNLQAARSIKEAVLEENSLELATTYMCIANVFRARNDVKEALEKHSRFKN